MKDYDVTLVDAVRLSDMVTLKRLLAEGRTMSACNRYSESILHMAARRSSFDVVEFILQNGGDLNIVDDYGRTPLHDACWRTDTSFDIITLLLDLNLDLIRTADIRGACPLSYVRECHWLDWCAYFFHQKEKYWEHISMDATITKEECSHHNTTSIASMQAANTPDGEEKSVSTEMNVDVEHPGVDRVPSEGSTIKTSA
jgi:ankyrin repeat protein